MKSYSEYRDVVSDYIDNVTESFGHMVFIVMENMRSDHMKDVSALIDAINDMHMTYHGHETALVMCPVAPCNTVYDIVRGAHRGDLS